MTLPPKKYIGGDKTKDLLKLQLHFRVAGRNVLFQLVSYFPDRLSPR